MGPDVAAQKNAASPRTGTSARKAASRAASATAGGAKTEKPAKKATAKSTTKQPAAKKTTAKKATAKKSASKKTTAGTSKAPAASSSTTKAAAKTATKPAAKSATKPAAKTSAKSPLTAADVREFRKLISGEVESLRKEYDESIAVLDELKLNGSDNAGDDPADAGTKTFEREHEMSIANNRLDLITQMDRALERLEAGTYGLCENCGKPIPKGRLQAFPSATLCVACKSREERR